MSLVNDMLRDLDARRRDTPSNGSDAERLMPASERLNSSAGDFSGLAKTLIAVGFGILLAAIVLFLLLFFRGEYTEVPVVVTEAAPVTPPMPVIAVPVRQVATQDVAVSAEIERLANRMQELEAQNRMLQAQASTASNQAAEASLAPVFAPAADLAIQLNDENITASELSDDSKAVATAMSPTTPVPVVERSLASVDEQSVSESNLVRSPSELSFRDRDRLQVQQALEAWQQGQRNAALQLLRDFSQNNLEAHQSREMLAKLLLQQGDSIEALSLVDLGLQIAPGFNGYRKIKARILMSAGVPQEAADLLNIRAPSLASDAEYHELQAASFLASKQFEEAFLVYDSLSQQAPDQARWWYGRAASLDALGRGFEAAQSYERALRVGGLSTNLNQLSQQRINVIRQN